MFADDSSILIVTSNDDELNQICNSVLLHILKWFQVNQFVLLYIKQTTLYTN